MRNFLTCWTLLICQSLLSQGLPVSSLNEFGGNSHLLSSSVAPLKRSNPNSEFEIVYIDSCESSVNFQISVLDPKSGSKYSWFSDGSISLSSSNGISNSGTVDSAGIYFVKLSTTRGFRRSSSIDSLVIVPNPKISIDTLKTCFGQGLSLNPIVNDCPGCSYIWSTGDTTASITQVFQTNTTITLKVTNQFGCSDSTSIPVVVTAIPNVNVVYDTVNICYGDSVLLAANSDQISKYFWSNGDTVAQIYAAPIVSTLYTVYCVNSIGCISDTISTWVNVYSNPTVSLPDDVWLCTESMYNATAIASGFGTLQYAWSGGGLAASKSLLPGNYTEYLSVTDAHGCTTLDSIVVHTNDFELETADNQMLCFLDSIAVGVQLTLGSSNYSVIWEYAGDTVKTTTHSDSNWKFSPMQTDTLYGFATSDSGCFRVLKQFVLVNPLPENTVVNLNETYSNLDTVWLKSELRNQNYTYEYLLNGTHLSSSIDTFWLPYDSGNYLIELVTIDTNGCQTIVPYSIKIRWFGDKDVFDIVYPNPANSVVYISFDSEKDEEYQILIQDAIGRTLFVDEFTAIAHRELREIDISGFTSGSHTVFVLHQGQILFGQIINVVH